MDEAEQKLWADMVKAVNRTDTALEWVWGGILYILGPYETKFLARHVVLAGIRNHPINRDSSTGLVMNSLIGIDDPNTKYPVDKLSVNVSEVAQAPKSEDSNVLIDGRVITKKVIHLRPQKDVYGA